MPAVARQLDSANARIRARQPLDHFPGPITTAVVDEHNLAARRYAAVHHHPLQQPGQTARSLRQHFLLVEARNHDSESRNDIHVAARHGHSLVASLTREWRGWRTG